METTTDTAEMFRALVTSRHSTRGFLPEPVPDARLVEIVVDKQGDTKVHLQEIEFLP